MKSPSVVIAVDFDGTCVDHCFPEVGETVPYCVEVLREFSSKGFGIILYTMRGGPYLQAAIDWYVENNIPLYGIQTNPTQQEWTDSPKCYAHYYIDDLAVGCPLAILPDFNRPFVNWQAIRKIFVSAKLVV
jgi:hypothetical protein